MLSDLELKIVEDCKIEGYMNFMSPLYIGYDALREKLTQGKLSDPKKLKYFYNVVDNLRLKMDYEYFNRLPKAPANPLKLEQEAWSILSKRIGEVQKKFRPHIERDIPEDNLEEYLRNLAEYLDTMFSLLEKVTIIARSYGEKYDIAIYKNSLTFAHIPYETWFDGIPKKEKAVKDLIEELRKEDF